MWDMIDKMVPGVRGVWIMDEAGTMMPVISIQQQYAGQAKEAAMVAATFSGLCRFIIVVDDDIDPSNMSEVIWALGTRCDPETGIDIVRGTLSNIKDPLISPEKRDRNEITTSTAIVMACKPYSWIEEFPASLKSSPDLLQKTREKWAELFE